MTSKVHFYLGLKYLSYVLHRSAPSVLLSCTPVVTYVLTSKPLFMPAVSVAQGAFFSYLPGMGKREKSAYP